MVRWWAAFFIAGLVAPPDARTASAASLIAFGLAIVSAASALHGGRMPDGRFGRGAVLRSIARFAACGAVGVILWQCAGLDRLAHEIGGAHRSGRPAEIDAGALAGCRRRLLSSLDDGRLSRRARGLVGALILDERAGLDFTLSETYSYVGITHFLALSGMHLGAIAIPLSFILARFIRSRRWSDVCLLGILCGYSAIAGFPASLLRALFLCAAIIGFRRIGTHTDLIGALATGSWILIAVDPPLAFDVGFQLSFAAVCGIALVSMPLSREVEARMPRGAAGAVAKAVLFPALITCSVQFLTMPLVVSVFTRASCYSPLANVLVSIPFTVLLYAGFLYVFLPLGPVRALLAPGINPLCRFLEAAPRILARGPHAAVYRGDFSVDAYLCGAALTVWSLQQTCPRRRCAVLAGAALCALAFAAPIARFDAAHRSPAAGPSTPRERILRISCPGAEYFGAGAGIIFVREDFSAGDAYRFTRSLWGAGVRSAGICVVTPSHLRRNHGLYYLITRIRLDEVLCTRYLLVRAADLPARMAATGGRVRAVSAGDVLGDGRWRLEITGPPFPPPSRGAVRASEAALTWRLIAGRTTSLDLPSERGYHAVP
jgi:ComEC/Rec2-related protein